jgi:hypothetical protein
MKKFLFIFIVVFMLSAYVGVKLFWKIPQDVPLAMSGKVWPIQGIDTVKYSRDLAREKLNDPSFDIEIEKQVREIAATGATYIALGTPYNDEFMPYLKRWVDEARKKNLHVWFRGNIAGWEGWFEYSKTTRDEHTKEIVSFIEKYPDLFMNGDIFTSCPECENGGPGDPRTIGDIDGFRTFLISENNQATDAFKRIHKNVASGYYSMNGDVAKLVMNEDTTRALGGIVTIDHYVSSPDKLISFIDEIAASSKGKVVLGEWGAPIPDINGEMSDNDQALWIADVLDKVSHNKNVVGVNYWTNKGGSTALWNDLGAAKKAVAVLSGYYSPRQISGEVNNELGYAVYGASVKTKNGTATTDYAGRFRIEVLPDDEKITIEGVGYLPKTLHITDTGFYDVTLIKQYENGLFRFAKWLHSKVSS